MEEKKKETGNLNNKPLNRTFKKIDPEKIVYLDESGIDECLHREYGYAPRGEKVIESISGKGFLRTNIVAAKMGNRCYFCCFSYLLDLYSFQVGLLYK